MRLIDADGVIKEIEKNKLLAREPATVRCMEIIKNATTFLQPTSYDVDKVVRKIDAIPNSRLSGYPNCCEYDYGLEVGFKECAREAIEIVRKGGEDEKNICG